MQDDNEELSEYFGFPVNIDLVLKHLRQDMRDDWYFDVLQYKDLFENRARCVEVIKGSFSIGNGSYHPNSPTVRAIPKKGYSERYTLETDFFDRFVYQAAVSYLIQFVDPMLSNRVLSYRYEKYPIKDKYLFKNKIERWNTFEGASLTFLRSGQCLVVTDLSNFFERISSHDICDRMEKFIPDILCLPIDKARMRSAISCLRSNLLRWTFSSGIGLPQNRDASSFLSNVALYEIDKKMEELGYDYLRYVDDIRILCATEQDARKALSLLTQELRENGFYLNGTKTDILHPDVRMEDLVKVFTGLNSKIAGINNMWKSKSRRVISRSVCYLCSLLEDCVNHSDTQSRTFRYAINRLSQLVQVGMIDIKSDTLSSLRDILVNSFYDNAASTDQYCRILCAIDPDGTTCEAIEKYLCTSGKSIYDWQNYNLWLMLARHKHSSKDLRKRAERIIDNNIESGEAAGVLVWAASTKHEVVLQNALDKYLHMCDLH